MTKKQYEDAIYFRKHRNVLLWQIWLIPLIAILFGIVLKLTGLYP